MIPVFLPLKLVNTKRDFGLNKLSVNHVYLCLYDSLRK